MEDRFVGVDSPGGKSVFIPIQQAASQGRREKIGVFSSFEPFDFGFT